MNSRRHLIPLAVFFAAFSLYLHTAGPTLVAYRDAGEMAASVTTLGVLHPTSYPLYSVTGHLMTRLPLGNPAYRLNVFSSIAMATAWALFYLLLVAWGLSVSAALVAVGFGAVSYHFWAHALVSEMYTLNLVFLCAILLALVRRQRVLAAFLLGLGCANRSDLILCLPAFLIFICFADDVPVSPRAIAGYGFFFLMGLSLYLYLPLRALQHPVLNWNDPSTVDRLIRSLFRLGYGGTLDLLSKSYATGENFLSEFWLYLQHVTVDFGYVVAPAILIGLYSLWRERRPWFTVTVVGFLVTGPLFIFLGNLPSNPHAVAIMESAYLVPDLFLLMIAAVGFQKLLTLAGPRGAGALGLGLVALMTVQGMKTATEVTKRDHYLADDFIRNVYHTLPPFSWIVSRSDVPAFSLFYGHWVHPASPDRIPIAQGLAGSVWYQRMMAEQVPGLQVSVLTRAEDWTAAAKINPQWTLWATNDLDWFDGASTQFDPRGLLSRLKTADFQSPSLQEFPAAGWRALYVRRGVYRYGAYRDFFSNELVEEYSKAVMTEGSKEAFLQALSYKPDFPYAPFRLGYAAFTENRFDAARHYFRWAIDLFHGLLRQADDWKSQPAIRHGIQLDLASALADAGVNEEHLGQSDKAQSLYEDALQQDPDNVDAHYNLAVLYWKKGDWHRVVDHLQAMARARPEDPRWKAYLPVALQHLK